jgi:hypothetical protein
MLPLDGDEDIGEVARARFREGRYPVWKSAKTRLDFRRRLPAIRQVAT